jgi:hypothetical protein
MSMLQKMSAGELSLYLEAKGLLHDCSISFKYQGECRVELHVSDVNAALKGFPEYEGCVACVIALEGVSKVDPVTEGQEFKVVEALIEQKAEGDLAGRLLVTFWPEGHLRPGFSHAFVHEDAAVRTVPR